LTDFQRQYIKDLIDNDRNINISARNIEKGRLESYRSYWRTSLWGSRIS